MKKLSVLNATMGRCSVLGWRAGGGLLAMLVLVDGVSIDDALAREPARDARSGGESRAHAQRKAHRAGPDHGRRPRVREREDDARNHGRRCDEDEPGGGSGGQPPTAPVACQGTVASSPLISDFNDATSGAPIVFGAAPQLSGGTFAYAAPGLTAPELTLAAGDDATPALHVVVEPGLPPDVASNYFGFGLYFDSCVDASAFDSIQFRLDGDLGDCNIAFAATSSQNVSPSDDPRGACTLESCFPPAAPVTSSGIVRVHFAELLGGSPGIIDPASLIGVQWQMSAPDGAACRAAFSIDDVTFVDGAVPITPDSSGRVEATANPLGVEGQWSVYGDSYGVDGEPPGGCQAAGHAEDECSIASLPDSTVSGFPNVAGKMCTTGSTARVLEVGGQPDYAHMWGIGIGMSLAHPGDGQPAGTYDADAHQVVGLSFEIDNVPPGLRVELPTPVDPPFFGASYWGADELYTSSPVRVGTNVVRFEDVRSPDPTAPALDTTQLQQIGFLVSSNEVQRTDFSYCISNLKLLVE